MAKKTKKPKAKKVVEAVIEKVAEVIEKKSKDPIVGDFVLTAKQEKTLEGMSPLRRKVWIDRYKKQK